MQAPTDGERRVRRARDVVWRVAGGRVLVRDVGTGLAADLVGPAAVVWVAVDHGADAVALVTDLGLDLGVISGAITSLAESGWIVWVDE